MIEEPTPQKTPLSALGEFGLIQRLTEAISLKNTTSVLGVGDDAAVLDFGPDNEVVVTKDLLLEGVHFDLSYMPLKHLGYKAAAVNLSDLCAMNATPSQLLVGLAVSNRFTVEALEEIYHGLYLACDRYGVDLVGGDTTSSQTGLMLSVTALGHVKRGTAVRRSGASATDLLVVTGDLGGVFGFAGTGAGESRLAGQPQSAAGAPGPRVRFGTPIEAGAADRHDSAPPRFGRAPHLLD